MYNNFRNKRRRSKMQTIEQVPWVPYLYIDEETGERKIREDMPEEIRNKYNEYLRDIERKTQNGELIAK